MREPSKANYTKIIIDLIYFSLDVQDIWAHVDLKHLDELIEIIKYYRQFAKE